MLNHPSQIDLVFHALSDPTRRVMVERLHRGALSVSDLAGPLPMSLPAVMQHLRVLEASGIVRSEKAGRVRVCRIDRKALDRADAWFASRRATWERRFDRLGELLAEDNAQPKPRRR